jgi:CheY-like chemotaxis protein
MTQMVNDKKRKVALVVDDSVLQCKVLGVLLQEEGYGVLIANDGAKGVAMYIEHQPDLVLMDINMPIMNGYQATRQIKSLSHGNLAPLIFITSMETEQAYIDSIDAGGDGILVRPFSPAVFKATIKSLQRINDLYSQVKSLQQAQQKDAEIAEQVMSGVIRSRNFGTDKIGIIQQAAALFSGDVQLTAQGPSGDIYVLLGDFTGHGLRSCIGAIPLAETFHVMSKKGFSLFEIIAQINSQLFTLLPVDLFFCATFISIASDGKAVYSLNAGLPDAYVFDEKGTIKHQIESSHPPLGVLPRLLEEARMARVSVVDSDRVVLISDGILEARNQQGEMFGVERFERIAKRGILHKQVAETISKSINRFCQEMPQEDDISLIDIPCGGWQQDFDTKNQGKAVTASLLDEAKLNSDTSWCWQLSLVGQRLASVNPVPMAMHHIHDIEGTGEHWQVLYTILTELFVNALDHGVLALRSDYKTTPEGFSQYFLEREKRLKDLVKGKIDISLTYHLLKTGGKMEIIIEDDGDGFDHGPFCNNEAAPIDNMTKSYGRGIALARELSESLEYRNNGTWVKATYVWQQ